MKDYAIISGAADKTLRLWTQVEGDVSFFALCELVASWLSFLSFQWKSLSLEGHKDSVNSLAVLKVTGHGYNHLVATAASDGLIVVWGCDIQDGKGLPNSLFPPLALT